MLFKLLGDGICRKHISVLSEFLEQTDEIALELFHFSIYEISMMISWKIFQRHIIVAASHHFPLGTEKVISCEVPSAYFAETMTGCASDVAIARSA